MSTVLANLVVRLCGFHDIHDSHTEIDKQHLTNAIPYLMVIRPQLVDRYKYNIRQCYKKGIHSHRDAAKILRRILKKHGRALLWRRTTRRDSGRCISCYKYRMAWIVYTIYTHGIPMLKNISRCIWFAMQSPSKVYLITNDVHEGVYIKYKTTSTFFGHKSSIT